MPTLTLEQALQLGDQHLQAGRVEEAKLVFQRVLEAAPSNAAALSALANLVLREGDPAQAVQLLDAAIRAEPRVPLLRSRLGFALLGIQHVTEAAAAFQSAIDLDPNFGAAHYGLSWTQLLQGDFALPDRPADLAEIPQGLADRQVQIAISQIGLGIVAGAADGMQRLLDSCGRALHHALR